MRFAISSKHIWGADKKNWISLILLMIKKIAISDKHSAWETVMRIAM